jgi:glucose-specific phosphotransferase system IIA component
MFDNLMGDLKKKLGFNESAKAHESVTELEREPMTLLAPLSGQSVALKDVKDEVFSKGILGGGGAILPDSGVVYSPVDGKVAQIFDTLHALTIVSDEGIEILIHIGLETVALKGNFFESFVKVDDAVKAGQVLIKFDLDGIKNTGCDTVVPVIITNYESRMLKEGEIKAHEPFLQAFEDKQ